VEVVLALLLIFGGVHAAKKGKNEPIAKVESCGSELRFAERDLSGATKFEAGNMIYRTEDGVICKG
jgi:hypothetical protein